MLCKQSIDALRVVNWEMANCFSRRTEPNFLLARSVLNCILFSNIQYAFTGSVLLEKTICLTVMSNLRLLMDDLHFRENFNLGITKDISGKKLSKLEKLQNCCEML